MKLSFFLSALLLCQLSPMLAMEQDKQATDIPLCIEPYDLPASKSFQTFVAETNVKTCYSYFVDLAQQSPKEAGEKISSTIQGFSKRLVQEFTKEKISTGKGIQKIAGLMGIGIGKGFGFCVRGFALDGLINSKEAVGDTFLAAESAPEKNMENKPVSLPPKQKSIMEALKGVKNPDETLYPKLATVCTAKVLASMGKHRDRNVEEILNVHKKKPKEGEEKRKEPPAFVRKIMKYSIPLFIDHCAANQLDWLLFAYMLGENAWEKQKEAGSLDLEEI